MRNTSSGHSNTPRVIIVTCGYKDLYQTYKNIENIISEEPLTPNAFNEGVNVSTKYDIFCFLDRYSDFAQDNVVEIAVNTFLKYPELGGIYTDNIVGGYRQYFPSYSYQTINDIVIDTPFFCRAEAGLKFNLDLTSLYYDNAIKQLGQHVILHHIPEALFEITN